MNTINVKSSSEYARIISCYAADTAGVCSALFELGGMVIVHDASGCNSTYATHDEPRWYNADSMIYISALTELDAVLGNDEKFIDDVSQAAKELKPEFIAICGSPMPMMTGFDFDAVADEINFRTGIKTISIKTNGMNSYLLGEGDAFYKIAQEYCDENFSKTKAPSANILGLTPLDFLLNGSDKSIRNWLSENGFNVISSFGMGTNLEEIKRSSSAWVNLVVSYGGLKTAEYMKEKFSIPYVVGVPIGKAYSSKLAESLKTASQNGKCIFSCADRKCNVTGRKYSIVGESVFSGSLACALSEELNLECNVLHTLETDQRLLSEHDKLVPCESDCEREFGKTENVIGDRLFKPICPDTVNFFCLSHEAFSGRCFHEESKNLINKKLGELV